MRRWLADLPEAAWSGATRCAGWSVSDLVQHLASGAQFLGYTLHEAKKGRATNLLEAFDPQVTPGAAASQFATLDRVGLLDAVAQVDDRVRRELEGMNADEWHMPAEAPMGRVPAYVSVNHFLFDSWVHERDLMLPVGETPLLEPNEVAAVVAYVTALAGCAPEPDGAAPHAIVVDLDLSSPGVHLHVTRADGVSTVVTGAAFDDAVRVEGSAADVVDFATGRRTIGAVDGDTQALDFLRNLAEVLA
jgi:uncharacterized protein (TIGR03083 family)